jgi:hypothetical protein
MRTTKSRFVIKQAVRWLGVYNSHSRSGQAMIPTIANDIHQLISILQPKKAFTRTCLKPKLTAHYGSEKDELD